MRKALMVAGREYRASAFTKGFLLSLLVAPLLLGGGWLALVLFEHQDHPDTRDMRIGVVDRSGLLADALLSAVEDRNKRTIFEPQTGRQVLPAFLVEVLPPTGADDGSQRLHLSRRLRTGDLNGLVEIGASVLHPNEDPEEMRVSLFSGEAIVLDARVWFEQAINEELRRLRLAQLGVQPSQALDLFEWIRVESFDSTPSDLTSASASEEESVNEAQATLIPLGMAIMMFVMLMIGAMPLFGGVMEERAQGIAEVMLGSVSPFEFMLGKLLGGLGVSLTAAVVYVLTGAVGIRHWGLQSLIPLDVIPWFFAYMVLAILMVGAMLAAFGSSCNDWSEAQSLQLFTIIPFIVPLFLALPVVMEPHAPLSVSVSLFPLFTPPLMILRLSMSGGVPVWQPWVGLVGVALFAALFIWVGGRVFRVGILMQGTPPKLTTLMKWAVSG